MSPSTSTFEDRLLDSLLDRFDALAQQTSPIITPALRRPNIRRIAIAAGCVVVTAAGTTVALTQGGSAPTGHAKNTAAVALADWTSQPTTAVQGQISGAEDHCAATFDQTAGNSGATSSEKQGPVFEGTWNPVLVDTRDDLTLTLYSNGAGWMVCLETSSFVLISPANESSQVSVADDSAVLDKLSIRGAGTDGYTVAIGTAGSAVTGVGLQRTDGSVVTATVGDGRYIAWWPGALGVSALSVTTNSGTQSVPVDQSFAQSDQPNNETVRDLGQPGNKP